MRGNAGLASALAALHSSRVGGARRATAAARATPAPRPHARRSSRLRTEPVARSDMERTKYLEYHIKMLLKISISLILDIADFWQI